MVFHISSIPSLRLLQHMLAAKNIHAVLQELVLLKLLHAALKTCSSICVYTRDFCNFNNP